MNEEMQKGLGRLLQEANKRKIDEQNRDVAEKILQLNEKNYGKSAAYENVIVLGGYGALFTIWSATSSNFTLTNKLASALLMGLSVTFYISWHLIQMVSLKSLEIKKANTVKLLPNYESFVREWVRVEAEEGEKILTIINIFWLPIFIPTVVFGFSAGILVLYSCLASLFNWPMFIFWKYFHG